MLAFPGIEPMKALPPELRQNQDGLGELLMPWLMRVKRALQTTDRGAENAALVDFPPAKSNLLGVRKTIIDGREVYLRSRPQ